MDKDLFDTRYPSSQDLRAKAQKRVPKFAFEYLIGGAGEEVNLRKNHEDIQEVKLMPQYIKKLDSPDHSIELFGKTYSAPFGMAPIGLQGLIWPNSPVVLAKAANQQNIPFVLSTVTTSSIEDVSLATEGNFWFQLYHPSEEELKKDVLNRAWDSGCRVLVALADTPSFGIRYKDIKNGLSMPPKLSIQNILQIMGKPNWALETLVHGQPNFATLKPYMPKNLNLSQLGKFMNDTFNGRLDDDKLKALRDQWKGTLVIKGVVNEKDAEKTISIGADGVIVSNHGGRQLDAGESTIHSLRRLVGKYSDKLTFMMDGGVESGADIAKCLATGAKMCFLGRTFMYGVGALGNRGGNHTINMLKMQLRQIMDQLGCETIEKLTNDIIIND